MSEQNQQNKPGMNRKMLLFFCASLFAIGGALGAGYYLGLQNDTDESRQTDTGSDATSTPAESEAEELLDQDENPGETDTPLTVPLEQPDQETAEPSTVVEEDEQVATQEPTPGIIEGSLSYPSSGIPPDLQVCAQDIATDEETCTSEQIQNSKYLYGFGYRLEVPASTYYVYATVPSQGEYKAYYNEFVTCGLSVDCPSHAKLAVEVQADETASGIDPGDWYDQTQQ